MATVQDHIGEDDASDIKKGCVVEIGDVVEYIYMSLIDKMHRHIKNTVATASGKSAGDEPDNKDILGNDKEDTTNTKAEYLAYLNSNRAKIKDMLSTNNNSKGKVISAANIIKSLNAIVTDLTRLRAYKTYTATQYDYYYSCAHSHGSHFAYTKTECEKTAYNYVFMPKTSKAYPNNCPAKKIGNFSSGSPTQVKTAQNNVSNISVSETDIKFVARDIILAGTKTVNKSFEKYIDKLYENWKTYVDNHSIFYSKISDGGTKSVCQCSCHKACDGRSRR